MRGLVSSFDVPLTSEYLLPFVDANRGLFGGIGGGVAEVPSLPLALYDRFVEDMDSGVGGVALSKREERVDELREILLRFVALLVPSLVDCSDAASLSALTDALDLRLKLRSLRKEGIVANRPCLRRRPCYDSFAMNVYSDIDDGTKRLAKEQRRARWLVCSTWGVDR